MDTLVGEREIECKLSVKDDMLYKEPREDESIDAGNKSLKNALSTFKNYWREKKKQRMHWTLGHCELKGGFLGETNRTSGNEKVKIKIR